LDIGGETVILNVETDYPHGGRVRITIEKSPDKHFTLALRIPGWAREKPVPGDLYQFATPSKAKPYLSISGKEHDISHASSARGYANLSRNWKAGDVIELDLPMPVRRVLAKERVAANQGRVALQRGPLVYCIEAIDNGGLRTDAIVLPDDAELEAARKEALLGGAVVVTGNAMAAYEPRWGAETEFRHHNLVAIPYHVWANRGGGYMDIWLPRTAAGVTPIPAVTAAGSAKISSPGATTDAKPAALNDGRYGPLSETRATPRFTWSGQNDGTQWIQYEWPQPRELSRTAVYWAVDRRQQVYWGERIRGEDLVLPKSWRVLYQDGDKWLPVETREKFTLRLDDPNEVRFKPVTTQAVRIEVETAAAPSAVQEWWID
jgi:uncharacterized protein